MFLKETLQKAQKRHDLSGASEGNLAWYGQLSEEQFAREGGVAEPNILEI